MRNGIIGIIIGAVIGVVVGATVIAPRLTASQNPLKSFSNDNASTEELPLAPRTKPGMALKQGSVVEQSGGPVVQWKMASAYGSQLPQLGTLSKRIEKQIWDVSGGKMEIKFFEPGVLVPLADMFSAVSSATVDAAFASPGMWSDRFPALNLFASVPFGPEAGEYLAWIYFGGGRAQFESILKPHNIHGLFCGIIAPEASGWFRKEIVNVESLNGLNMRLDGLGAKVMQKLGVKTHSIAPDAIFPALESGSIDATEFSMPAIDRKLGFHKMTRHYYFPGWHQPATLFTLMINLDKWKALNATEKSRLESICGDNIRYGLAEGEALQFGALKAMIKQGVLIHRWPGVILEAFDQAWRQVAIEESKRDKKFRSVWKSLTAFRRDYSIWKELGYL